MIYYSGFNVKYDSLDLDRSSYIYYEDLYDSKFLQGCIHKIYDLVNIRSDKVDVVNAEQLQIHQQREPNSFRYYSKDFHNFVNDFIGTGSSKKIP